jgi:hypothetical protein
MSQLEWKYLDIYLSIGPEKTSSLRLGELSKNSIKKNASGQ